MAVGGAWTACGLPKDELFAFDDLDFERNNFIAGKCGACAAAIDEADD